MNYQAMRRHGGTLNAYYYIKESQSENAPHCVIPTIWHSEKGKTMETVKRPIVAKA